MGCWDARTGAYAIIKGRRRPLDVYSVLQPPRRYYGFVSINYGLIANLDVGTEHLRCAERQAAGRQAGGRAGGRQTGRQAGRQTNGQD
jgi:hypothetical protein